MVFFLTKRLIQSVFVMLAVAFLAFSLFRYVGDPVSQMTGVETSVEDRERLREDLGLNDPFVYQFVRFTGDLLKGDFGYSYRTRQPVAEMIASRIPATLELGLVALMISLLVGIPAGVYTALRPRGFATQTILMLTLVGVSIPTFVIGIMLIFFFGVQLGWLPTFGRGGTVSVGGWETSFLTIDGWRSLILPALTLGVYQLTLTMRLVRAEMMDVMQSDYIRFATARGVPMGRMYFRHALSNTMVPVITIIGLQFGGVIAFSIVTESVFQWPGMGLLFLESIRFVDIPVMGVYLVVIAFFFVLVNLIVDLLYVLIDPRLRISDVS
ncbi:MULTISPECIES: ABC transporter permease [Halocynthiibacter]|uniref:ABC transporter permease n=1 Tax=Halocynthiibacter halioticoli TaxID=2986804 RepID=A0AAE3LP79_9RHOB|nr:MULTISPECIES: ABC transporter permease [Halocynthiibacter]MCV6823047.1 ABC transporter permease [Halocynthiibacter halioticoli]MCW4056048.1 ABC transporter permease [Halocynthiibacter sp. SDUM655004]